MISYPPLAIIARPRGIPTPVIQRIKPRAIRPTLLACSFILLSTPEIFVFIVSQFTTASVTNPTAPVAIRAIPKGRLTPLTARIIPTASDNPATTPAII